ncbi:hypothetical protein QR680_010474 [Steinernema hermaphroditum]|uniref:F-box domain-containing protein n=1 Tax=Steinernema hermaphroditum TaxID=289476 RepID=A0AA39IQK7_9BILA|nr:hypothetical protein QR680_010474 [Steinernema hermaphroditum]
MNSLPFRFFNSVLSLLSSREVESIRELDASILRGVLQHRKKNFVDMTFTFFVKNEPNGTIVYKILFRGKHLGADFETPRPSDFFVKKEFFRTAYISVRGRPNATLIGQHAANWEDPTMNRTLSLLRLFPNVSFQDFRAFPDESRVFSKLDELGLRFSGTFKCDANKTDFLKRHMREDRINLVQLPCSLLPHTIQIEEILTIFFESPTIERIHLWNENYHTKVCQYVPMFLRIWAATEPNHRTKKEIEFSHFESNEEFLRKEGCEFERGVEEHFFYLKCEKESYARMKGMTYSWILEFGDRRTT